MKITTAIFKSKEKGKEKNYVKNETLYVATKLCGNLLYY